MWWVSKLRHPLVEYRKMQSSLFWGRVNSSIRSWWENGSHIAEQFKGGVNWFFAVMGVPRQPSLQSEYSCKTLILCQSLDLFYFFNPGLERVCKRGIYASSYLQNPFLTMILYFWFSMFVLICLLVLPCGYGILTYGLCILWDRWINMGCWYILFLIIYIFSDGISTRKSINN